MFGDVIRLILAVVLIAVLPQAPLVDIGGWLVLAPLVVLLFGFLCGRLATRAVLHRPGQKVQAFERRRVFLLRLCRSLDLLLFGLLVGVFGWISAVNESSFGISGLREALWLTPFVSGSIGAAAGSFRLATFFWQPKPSMVQYTGLRLRVVGTTAALAVALYVGESLFEQPGLRMLLDCFESLHVLAAAVLIVAMYLLFPLVLRYVFPSRALPEGPLRSELLAMAKGLRVRLRGVLLWDTQGARLSTAFVTGTTGWSRWVFISDGLLTSLRTDQVVAVFAHELGHVLRKHALFYLLYVMSFLFLVLPLDHLLEWAEVPPSIFIELGILLAFVLVWLVTFSYLSRRFELEADLVGLSLVDDPDLYQKTLLAVGDVSGGSNDKNSWRHFSINRRRDFVQRAATDDGFRQGWVRHFRRLRFGIVGIAVLCCLGFGYVLGDETGRSDGEVLLSGANNALRRGAPDAALEYLEQARKTGDSVALRTLLAQTWIALGDKEQALDALEQGFGVELDAEERDALREEAALLRQSWEAED